MIKLEVDKKGSMDLISIEPFDLLCCFFEDTDIACLGWFLPPESSRKRHTAAPSLLSNRERPPPPEAFYIKAAQLAAIVLLSSNELFPQHPQ